MQYRRLEKLNWPERMKTKVQPTDTKKKSEQTVKFAKLVIFFSRQIKLEKHDISQQNNKIYWKLFFFRCWNFLRLLHSMYVVMCAHLILLFIYGNTKISWNKTKHGNGRARQTYVPRSTIASTEWKKNTAYILFC